MTPDKKDPWAFFSEAFQHFDRGWAAADKGFQAASDAPASADGRKTHLITASNFRRRWKMFALFQRIAWRILFHGKISIKI